jgi:hypothetical protein
VIEAPVSSTRTNNFRAFVKRPNGLKNIAILDGFYPDGFLRYFILFYNAVLHIPYFRAKESDLSLLRDRAEAWKGD